MESSELACAYCAIFRDVIGVPMQIAVYAFAGFGQTHCTCGLRAEQHAMQHPHGCELGLCEGFEPREADDDTEEAQR